MRKRGFTGLIAAALALPCLAQGEDVWGDWRQEELRRFPAAEANQGVAVDAGHFYAITNRALGKYRRDTGEKTAAWEDARDGRLRHLNAGVIFEGKLHAAHSNYPALPEESSVEIWDAATLRHEGSHRFEAPPGSLTWVDRKDGVWHACFAHYRATSDPALTKVLSFDGEWKPLHTWTFPPGVVARFAAHSSSGGGFGPGGHLFVSGHDARELYVLALPEGGGEMTWLGTVAVSTAGQAFAWDRTGDGEGRLFAIERKTREVVESRIREGGFVSLFDGKTFEGWEHKGNWGIADGAFHRQSAGGELTFTREPVPDDFELRFEWKVAKGCNSGVYYRPGQYEYQVLDNAHSPYGENPRQAAASLFFCMAPDRDASKPFGEWNEGRILCKGGVIQHWLNGIKVLDFDYTDPRWSAEVDLLRLRGADLAARGGRLWLQDHGAPVSFRGLRWREIPEAEAVRADPSFTPMPIPPAALEKENARVEQMRAQRKAKAKPPAKQP